MCGIVGYLGARAAQEVLLNGLSKLEYRGYDSAGVAVHTGEQLQVKKFEGRLANLAQHLSDQPLQGGIGIGHTRWATHGRPSDCNAHPHTDGAGRFAVVHNGIIENYMSLKEQLVAKGHQFVSDTDTEVIAHLLSEQYDGDLLNTVQRTIKSLEGAYALAILCTDNPNQLIAVRCASPLVVGVGNEEFFVGSDVPALLDYTRQVYFLEEGEMAVISRDSGVQLMKLDGTPVERALFEVTWDRTQAEKGGYPHFMLKEIDEQPRAFRDTLAGRIQLEQQVNLEREIRLPAERIRNLRKIDIVACGTAYHAGLVGKGLFETLCRIPVEVEVASEYRYRNPLITEDTLVIVISQSGETADTLAALRESRRRGAHVVAVTNVVGSSAAREADDVVLTQAGPEIAVASTKAYTSQLIALFLIAQYFAKIRESLAPERLQSLTAELLALPQKAEQVLEQRKVIQNAAEIIKGKQDLFFIGRGMDYAVSMEGSLKLKEISYIHSEAYAAGELKHGTLALIEEDVPVIALATQSHLYEKMLSNIKEVKARGAYVFGMGIEGDTELEKYADLVLTIPRTEDLYTPILSVIPLQLLAYYTAVALGNDVDKPRNLAKSVTVE